jgi:hypothetical protein
MRARDSASAFDVPRRAGLGGPRLRKPVGPRRRPNRSEECEEEAAGEAEAEGDTVGDALPEGEKEGEREAKGEGVESSKPHELSENGPTFLW